MLVLSRYSLPLARPRKTLTPLTHQNALRTAVLPAYPPVGAAVFVGAAAQPKRRGKGACSGFALDQTRQLRTCFRVSCGFVQLHEILRKTRLKNFSSQLKKTKSFFFYSYRHMLLEFVRPLALAEGLHPVEQSQML